MALQDGYLYQRLGNPTCEQAEVVINELEGGQGSLVYASGLAAISSVLLAFLKAGDHLVCQLPIYSGTFEFVSDTLTKFGVEVTWAKPCPEEFAKAIKENTRMLYGETPCNPTMEILDLKKFGALGTSSILTMVDGTFASAYVQRPIDYGVDIVCHSCSKYMGGHTDVIAGCATVKEVKNWKLLKKQQASIGTALSPMDAAFLSRGLKTLPLRMGKHGENALAVAEFLDNSPKVKHVWYPGLKSHPQHELSKKQMKNFGGMISFEMKTQQDAIQVVESLGIINLCVSLGGTESLITVPSATTHGPMLLEKSDFKVSPGLIRFSVGLENVEDLIEDLRQALDRI